MPEPMVLIHGGVTTPDDITKGTEEAARQAMAILADDGRALDAVIAACIVMEDDPDYNAGTGAHLKLDGDVSMDAAVQDSTGVLGAVAALTDVRNPVLIARKVADSPHRLMVGHGALEFARSHGFGPHDCITEKNRKLLEGVKAKMRDGKVPEWAGDWKEMVELDIVKRHIGTDTVGAIAVDAAGTFAAATTTGGTPFSVRGRVGDSPLPGCGQYVGNEGAVAATGIGERIMDTVLSLAVYGRMVSDGIEAAIGWGMSRLRPDEPLGLLAIDKDGNWAIDSNMQMASTMSRGGETISTPKLLEGSRFRRGEPDVPC